MNKEDRNFYLYLRTMPEDEFDVWCQECNEEELDRAVRLFELAKRDAKQELDALLDEPTGDLSLAQSVLKKFTLSGE